MLQLRMNMTPFPRAHKIGRGLKDFVLQDVPLRLEAFNVSNSIEIKNSKRFFFYWLDWLFLAN